MNQKTILITGATDGIGLATAVELARHGHRMVLHGRNHARLQRSLEDVLAASPHRYHTTYCADMASLAAVSTMASEICADLDRLDVLINNAGVYMKHRELSQDGFEMTFAVNHLAHFLLTLDLIDLLRSSAPSRIVNVSSVSHERGKIDFGDIHASASYSPYQAYAQSKLANVLFTTSLAARLSAAEVTANALHPGVISTKLLRAGFSISGSSVEHGARTSVYAATSPELDGISGRYFADSAERKPGENATDGAAARKLWDLSVEMVGTVRPEWKPTL